MKKILAVWALGMTPGLCLAFDGELQFLKTKLGVEHVVKVNNWRVDKKGVPSFDYVYSQKGASCKYEVHGTVEALMEDDGKPLVINFEVAGGGERQVMSFEDKTVSFAFPYQKKDVGKYISLIQTFTPEMLKSSCIKKAGRLDIEFKGGK